MNETAYIEESHINLKLNKIKQEKKSKKNNLTLYIKKNDDINTTNYNSQTLSKSHKGINLSHKKINNLQAEAKKEEKNMKKKKKLKKE